MSDFASKDGVTASCSTITARCSAAVPSGAPSQSRAPAYFRAKCSQASRCGSDLQRLCANTFERTGGGSKNVLHVARPLKPVDQSSHCNGIPHPFEKDNLPC